MHLQKNLQEQISQSHLNVSAKVEEILRRESILTQEQFATLHQEAQTGFLTALSALEKVQGQDAVVHVARQALETAGGATAKLKQLLNCELVDFEKEILQRVEQIESKFEEKINTKLGQVTQGWALQFAQERAEVDKKIISHGQIVTREIKRPKGKSRICKDMCSKLAQISSRDSGSTWKNFSRWPILRPGWDPFPLVSCLRRAPFSWIWTFLNLVFLVQPPYHRCVRAPKIRKCACSCNCGWSSVPPLQTQHFGPNMQVVEEKMCNR